ncbi:MAG TPA: histidine kinase, partial [Ruminococcaceae bacterium]|nr:histidine kinase [Oscillospiraceae bacterium]
MSIIQLNSGNCKNCYKCVRECPIKSIQFKEERAKIIDNECILCGTCVESCPQNAKYVKNDVENVKRLIASGKPVYASIAPSWVGWYQTNEFEKISKALKKLGFAAVEETAIGAAETSREYAALLKNGRMKNIIVTACSSIVMLIERHYPELINMLAPVSSPMMAHARLMRESYGDIKVVFIGPCLSKKNEAEDPLAGGLVNYSLTFADVDDWLRSEEIAIDEPDTDAVGLKNTAARLYPKPGGIIKTIGDANFGIYKKIAADGIDNCKLLFESIINSNLTGLFIEANLCDGGCMGGPVMRIGKRNHIITQLELAENKQPRDSRPAASALIQFTHPRVFTNRSSAYPVPSEDVIRAILAKTGKYTPEQELNCSSCGYPTCRDKAIAVYQGKADINMCLPFFRDRAENIST